MTVETLALHIVRHFPITVSGSLFTRVGLPFLMNMNESGIESCYVFELV